MALLSALVIVGCGSSSSTTSSNALSPVARKAVKAAEADKRAAEAEAPKGASPTLRAIYVNFQKPQPDPASKGSGKAIVAGESACHGKKPQEVVEELLPAARTNLSPEQEAMIAKIGSYEARASSDADFVAGQLAGDVYQASLQTKLAQFGYQGCVYALAKQLEQRLAQGK